MKDERVCPSCGKAALPVATRCPRCGYAFENHSYQPADDRAPRNRLLLGLALLVAIALISANLLRHRGAERAAVSAPMGPPPVAMSSKPDSAPLTPPVVAESTPSPATEPAAAAPVPAPAPPPARRVIQPRADATYLFASTWINLRSEPNNRGAIVRVLKPSESVRVDSLAQGWYQVVTSDAITGYADARLLRSSAP